MTARDGAFSAIALFGLLACREPEPPVDIAPPAPSEESPRRRLFDQIPSPGNVVLLAAGDFHEYPLGKLASGDAVHIVFEQRGVDLLAEVTAEDDAVIVAVDSPTENHGFEHVCFVAHDGGTYRLRVRPWSAEASGSYGIRSYERASQTASERIGHCQEALRTQTEAERRRSEGSEEVTASYQRAVELWRRSQEPYPLAIALKQAGSFAALRGDLDDALRFYDEALALLRSLGEAGDPRQIAAVLNRAGLVRNLTGKPEQARASFEAALAISEGLGDRRGVAAAVSNLANWETEVGDLYRAVEYHQQALEIWRSLGRRSPEATTLASLGVTQTRLGRYEEALDVLRDALEIQIPDARPVQLGNTLVAIGWAEHLSGHHQVAVSHFRRAVDLYRQVGARLDEAGALDRLGSAYRELGRRDVARRAYEQSLEIYRTSADRIHTAHTSSNLGCLMADPELLEEAGETLTALGDRAALAHVRFCQARRERDVGHLDSALSRIEEAVGIVDVLRGTALRRGHQAPTLELWQNYRQLHVDILMRLHELEPGAEYDVRAFEVSDLARARHLYEILLEARIDVRSGVPEGLLAQELAVQRRLNAAELRRRALLQQESTAAEVAAMEKTLRGLLRELSDVQAAIRSANPEYAELRQPSPVRLREVRELLGTDTLLLSYVLGEERSFLFAVSRDGIESHVLPERRLIDNLAWRLYQGLRNSRQKRTRRQLPALSRWLGDMLLGPILGSEQLAGRRLLVVGDGMLHYIPFAALPLGEPGVPGTEGEDLVVDHFQVVHLPSAAVLKALRQRANGRPPPPKELAVIADAVYSAREDMSPDVRNPDASSVIPESLPDLPYTRKEAESILEMVAPEKRLGALGLAASPELVRGDELSAYRILHFAIHGLVHEEHPELSGVALSMFDEDGSPRDGHLRLHEIYALDLPADLVVLSACRTALTHRAQGTGLVGLTHGFFYAGASRLVVSLWDVHDEATAELMTAFYRGLLEERLSPPTALQEAQRWMRRQERWRAPFFWAGFVLEGDWHRVSPTSAATAS